MKMKSFAMAGYTVVLVLLVLTGITDSAPPRPIDEILAIAGNFKHGKANPRGLYEATGKKVGNGKYEIHEYDMALPIPDDDVVLEVNGKPQKQPGKHFAPQKENRRQRRAAISNTQGYWNGGEIPYVISSYYSQASRNMILSAMAEIHQYTCIRWVPRTTETNYVNIFSGSGCYSYLGNIFNGAQELSLADPGCLSSVHTPIHEMLHAAGVYHEQSRPDRDQYININWNNIVTGREGNFDKETDSVTSGTTYDYRSVMHYGAYAFSSNSERTIITTDPAYQNVIGTAPTLGFMDIKLVTSMYNCAGSCQPANCPFIGFQAHDCSCYCPSGNPNSPVVSCGEVCLEPNQQCTCESRPNACSGVSNSQCQAGACVCNSGYVLHNGQCTLLSSITCDLLGEDCKCSLKTNACSNLANSECDSSTNACFCKTGFEPDNGVCVSISSVACDEADKACFCSAKGATACNSVPNSSCDYASDSCKCNEDYYNNAGTCTAAPACTSPGTACMCGIQGADACSAIPYSQCDLATGTCQCISVQSGSVCTNGYILDGSKISPFTQSASNSAQWVPSSGSDSSAHGIPPNNKFLFTFGSGQEIGSIRLPTVSNAAGNWCINYAIDLNNAYFEVRTVIDGWWTYRYSLRYSGALNYFYGSGLRFSGVSSTISVEMVAYRYSYSGYWSMKLDNVKVTRC